VLGIHEEPRKLIESTEGYELIEMKDADKCWCMSGAFGVQHSTLSITILKQKRDNINDAGAAIVASACSGCMVQIQGGVGQQVPDKKMKHIADILAENISD
jgi:L-lactate dehydrogenase complex protein LldF